MKLNGEPCRTWIPLQRGGAPPEGHSCSWHGHERAHKERVLSYSSCLPELSFEVSLQKLKLHLKEVTLSGLQRPRC